MAINNYEHLSQDEQRSHREGISPHNQLQTSRKLHRPLILVFIAIFSILLIPTAYLQLTHHRIRTTNAKTCGTTPSTAISLNCTFDILSFAWQHPNCYDSALLSEFTSYPSSPWSFYLHPSSSNDSTTVPLEAAMRGEQDLWVDWKFHIVHCTFMWRFLQRGYERGWIDAHARSYNHTKHCGEMFLRKDVGDDWVGTRARVIYPECQKVGDGGAGHEGSYWDGLYGRHAGHGARNHGVGGQVELSMIRGRGGPILL